MRLKNSGGCLCGHNEYCSVCDGSERSTAQEAFEQVASELEKIQTEAHSQNGRTEAYELMDQKICELITDLRSGR